MKAPTEADVQAVIAMAHAMKPWSAEFKACAARAIARYSADGPSVGVPHRDGSRIGTAETIDLLMTAYLRAYGVRFGKQSAAELGKLLKDIQRANECASGKTGTPKRKVGRPSSKTKRADA